MSGVRMLQFLEMFKDWWKFIQILQHCAMALKSYVFINSVLGVTIFGHAESNIRAIYNGIKNQSFLTFWVFVGSC